MVPELKLTSCTKSGEFLDVGKLPGPSIVVSMPITYPSKPGVEDVADARRR